MASEANGRRRPVSASIDSRWTAFLQASEGVGVGPDLPTRSLIFDCILAAIFLGCGIFFLEPLYPEYGAIDLVFLGLVNIPLLLRRRLPRTSFLLIQCAGLVQIWMGSPIGLYDAAMLFSFYSLVGFTNRRTGLLGWIPISLCLFSGAFSEWWNFIDTQFDPRHEHVILVRLATTTAIFLLAFATWAAGERLRAARLGQVALADHAAQLERDGEQQAELAAAAERSRIAREMHDVIAHALSVMIAQADGGAYVIDQDPATAKKSLESISATGRDSLNQMRSLLGLLRQGTGDDHTRSAPQPGLEQLDQLITGAQQTGLRVELIKNGDPEPVPEVVGLTVYRVIQECLTNARKHGGDQVEIKIDFSETGIDVGVRNDVPDNRKRLQTGPPGHGLRGMQERVAAVGGRITAGPDADGYAVHAWVPHRTDTVSG